MELKMTAIKATQNTIITDISQLTRMTSLPEILTGSIRIDLQLPGKSVEDLKKWEIEINLHLAACGCKEGELTMATFLAGFVINLLINPKQKTRSGKTKLGLGFGVAIVGALLGKSYGLLKARLQLRKIIRALKAEVILQF
jgi:hypothetical protein